MHLFFLHIHNCNLALCLKIIAMNYLHLPGINGCCCFALVAEAIFMFYNARMARPCGELITFSFPIQLEV